MLQVRFVLELLENHPNEDIHQQAQEIIDTYFGDAVEDEDIDND